MIGLLRIALQEGEDAVGVLRSVVFTDLLLDKGYPSRMAVALMRRHEEIGISELEGKVFSSVDRPAEFGHTDEKRRLCDNNKPMEVMD